MDVDGGTMDEDGVAMDVDDVASMWMVWPWMCMVGSSHFDVTSYGQVEPYFTKILLSANLSRIDLFDSSFHIFWIRVTSHSLV